MTRTKLALSLSIVVVVALATGCAKPIRLLPGKPHTTEAAIDLPKERVFQQVVEVMHAEDYDVDVVESESGVLRLEPRSFEGPVMDRYCLFPAVYEGTAQRASTFAEYHQSRLVEEKTGITGTVNLSYLVTERTDGGTDVNLRSKWEVTNGDRDVACDSTGALEDALIDEVKSRLLAPGD